MPTQDLFQRSMSARNESTAVWGTYLAGVLYLFFGIMSPLIGIMMFKLNPDLANPDGVLVHAAITLCSARPDGHFHGGAGLGVDEHLRQFPAGGRFGCDPEPVPALWKETGRQATKSSGRASWSVINGFIGIVIAVTAAVIYELGVVAWTLLLVGLFVPFAFGMYWKKANRLWRRGGCCWAAGSAGRSSPGWRYNFGLGGDSTAMVCSGGDLSLLADRAVAWTAPSGMRFISHPSRLSSSRLLSMIVVSLATQKQDAPKPITDVDGNVMDTNPFHYLGHHAHQGRAPQVAP
ncbi:MAG: hypothetical protein MZV70_21490 [Desulfobacterales bacterium]|nr:hypothetical protein [Desulfobacterales bacterium]